MSRFGSTQAPTYGTLSTNKAYDAAVLTPMPNRYQMQSQMHDFNEMPQHPLSACRRYNPTTAIKRNTPYHPNNRNDFNAYPQNSYPMNPDAVPSAQYVPYVKHTPRYSYLPQPSRDPQIQHYSNLPVPTFSLQSLQTNLPITDEEIFSPRPPPSSRTHYDSPSNIPLYCPMTGTKTPTKNIAPLSYRDTPSHIHPLSLTAYQPRARVSHVSQNTLRTPRKSDFHQPFHAFNYTTDQAQLSVHLDNTRWKEQTDHANRLRKEVDDLTQSLEKRNYRSDDMLSHDIKALLRENRVV